MFPARFLHTHLIVFLIVFLAHFLCKRLVYLSCHRALLLTHILLLTHVLLWIVARQRKTTIMLGPWGENYTFFKKKREMKPKLCFWRQYDMWIFPFLSLSYWTHGRRVWFSNLPMATSADSYSQQMAPNLLQHQTTSERCEMGYRGRLDNSPLLPPHQSLTTSAWGTAKEHEKEQSNK